VVLKNSRRLLNFNISLLTNISARD